MLCVALSRAVTPGGVRIGTPAMTTRGMKEAEMAKIVEFLLKSVAVAKRIQADAGRKLAEFNPAVEADAEIATVRGEVHAFAS
jgi:glycine hydroxymethyltransferase